MNRSSSRESILWRELLVVVEFDEVFQQERSLYFQLFPSSFSAQWWSKSPSLFPSRSILSKELYALAAFRLWSRPVAAPTI
jgi:hypothetical protein